MLFVMYGPCMYLSSRFRASYPSKRGLGINLNRGTILIPLVIAYLLRPWNTQGLPLATVLRGASIVLVPSVTCDWRITPLRGHPCSQTRRPWVLHVGCLCVDTTLDRIRPLSQPQTTISAVHMYAHDNLRLGVGPPSEHQCSIAQARP
jgi:hypothetical protein